MAQEFSKKKMISDVLKYEDNNIYCRDKMTVTAGASDVQMLVGQACVKSTGALFTGASAAVSAAWDVTLSGEFSATPKPEIYNLKIGGTWAENETLMIGSTTFTAKADPTTSNQFSAGGTGAVIVEDIRACSLAVTGFTIAYSGDEITLTQTVAGTGSAPTVTPSSTAGTAVLSNTQNYRAADTITWGATTITVVASGAAGNQVNVGTNAEIASQLAAKTLTGFTVTASGNVLTCEQSSASSTETPPTVTVSSDTGTAATVKTRSYAAASGTNFDCIVLENHLIPAGETFEVLVLVRGPAIVDLTNIIAGSNTQAMTKARLEALGITTMIEPPFTHYQST